jgi:hypothetical protein
MISMGLAPWLVIAGAMLAQDKPADKDLPTVEQVMEKYISATGGKAAYEKVKGMRTVGRMELPNAGISGEIEISQAAPAKQYVVIEFDAVGKIESGTDGKVAWEINPMSGPRVKEGAEAAIEIRNALISGELKWKELYASAKVEGKEEIEGKPVIKVVFTPKEGEGGPMTEYFDAETGLRVKSAMTVTTPQGELPIEFKISDYRKVGDLLIPHMTTQTIAGQDIEIKIEKVELNPEFAADRFELPAAIKDLLKKG